MTYFLYGLFFLSCIVLVIAVLLQPGKTDAGALFTSNVSSNAYGTRGTATVLSKTTIIAATLFMLSALMLSMPALSGGVSVLSSNPDTTESTPAAATNANVDANAPAANTDANTISPVTVPPITNVSNVATPSNNATNGTVGANKAANAAQSNTTKANTAAKKEANTKK